MKITDLPKDKHHRFLEAATMAAFLSPGIGGRKSNRFRLGAAIVYKKRILITKFNMIKTHPALLKFTEYPYKHAEMSAILGIGFDNCLDAKLYVSRILKNEHLALAKPCPKCMSLIKFVGIKSIYYTTYEGYEVINV